MLGIGQTIKYASIFGIVACATAGGWYIIDIHDQLHSSKESVKNLKSAVELQQGTISQIQNDQKQISLINADLATKTKKQEKDIKELISRFSQTAAGTPRNFGTLAAEHPALVERLINNGSRSAARCIEIASGSPLTEAENNAKDNLQINKECPSLVDSFRSGQPR